MEIFINKLNLDLSLVIREEKLVDIIVVFDKIGKKIFLVNEIDKESKIVKRDFFKMLR